MEQMTVTAKVQISVTSDSKVLLDETTLPELHQPAGSRGKRGRRGSAERVIRRLIRSGQPYGLNKKDPDIF